MVNNFRVKMLIPSAKRFDSKFGHQTQTTGFTVTKCAAKSTPKVFKIIFG